MLKTDSNSTATLSSKPINPPFVFRDPNHPNQVFGSASSVRELAEILPYIPYFSIEYHVHRIEQDNTVYCDLAAWLRYVLGLSELADQVEKISSTYSGLELKEQLVQLINTHIFAE
ncbi:MAG: DUF5752 family protein [Candidatus Heimdallarchaeaceae archaeon]